MSSKQREFKENSEYPDTWAVLQGHLQGSPIFIRYREGIRDAVGHPDYPFQIGVAVLLLNPTADGLISDSEADALNEIEDRLEREICQDGQALYAMTITFNGMREFVFYAHNQDSEYFEEKVKKVSGSNSSGHKLQFMIQPDREWNTYSEYTNLAQSQ